MGRRPGTPDLLVPGLDLGVDYEGEVHLGSERRHGDRVREERFRDHGLKLLVVMKQDLRDQVRFRVRLHSAIAEASRMTGRAWTGEPPLWWVQTDTVERRRALKPSQR